MHKLAEICIRRPVFATMLIASLMVIGGFSYFNLGVDLLPKVDLPTVVVTVINPGASPEEIETEITEKIEGAVNTISGIDELRSSSSEGRSQVIVSFVLEKNGDVGAQEVRDKVNLVLGELPETSESPIIQKIDPDASPVLQVVVSADLSLQEVTHLADKQIKEKIENIDGVGEVRIVGGRQREIRIWVDPDKMRAHSVTVAQVASSIRQQNMEMPGGRVEQGSQEMTVRTMGRIVDPREFNEIVVANRGTYAVKLSDIGYAEDSAEELRSATFLGEQKAVTLVVSKQSGKNTVTVANAVKQSLEELKSGLPAGTRVAIIGDQSVFIEAAVASIQTHLIEGSLLACLVIFFFLANLRTTLIAAVAIPTSIISTFGLMWAMGYTLNQITMLALTLMVGIVIDDAIIVLENIYRYIEEKGMPPIEAAIEGTREIGLAVMATTLSLLAVFLPIGFMGGIVGRFMSSFGLTASFAIAVSLVVSFVLTPMLCARFIKVRKGSHAKKANSKDSMIFKPIDRTYTWMLEWSMAHRKWVVAICVVVILTIAPLFLIIGKNFMPEDDRAEFGISLRAAEGSTLPATLTVARRIAREVKKLPEVTLTLTSVGGGNQGAVNEASIFVQLVPMEDRDLSQAQLMMKAREILRQFPPTLRTSVQPAGGIGGGGRNADVQYSITGPEIEKLAELSERLTGQLKSAPYITDVDTSLVTGKPELRVEIDRQRAADQGVLIADISQALNILVGGQDVSTFNSGTDQYNVRLRATQSFRDSPESLNRLIVSSSTRGWVALDQLVDIQKGAGPSSIDRLNRQRQVSVYANVLPGGSQAGVISSIDTVIAGMGLPSGYKTELAGTSKELGRAGYYFLLAVALSFIFMYMVLAAQFESFIHPVTILLTLPLAVPFGILSLLVMGQTVNIFSALGLLLLFGIVKKNAILQIDHTNGLRAQGLERYPAIIQANRDRLRPILMTTIALVAGMMPLVLSSGPGSATNRSIGVLVVGGQSLCLLLTLLAVPVFYSLFEDAQEHPVWSLLRSRAQRTTSLVAAPFARARSTLWAIVGRGKSSAKGGAR